MAMVHIIGAGVTGLAAATKLAEAHVPVRLYEATANAGGRARSSKDIKLGTVDHGLHLISGDSPELFSYLTRIGAREQLLPVKHPLRFSAAPIMDYLELLGIFNQRGRAESALAHDNILRHGWASRASRALLHTPFEQLGARAAQKIVRRFLKRRATRAYVAQRSLSETFIAPALTHLEYLGGSVYFNHALGTLERKDGRVTGLTFPKQKVAVGETDVVILATAAHSAAQLVPEIRIGGETHQAITVHFTIDHREAPRIDAPEHAPADLVRYQPGRISLSIRIANDIWHSDPEFVATRLWNWVCTLHPYLDQKTPAHAVCREKIAGHMLTADYTPHIPPLDARLLIAGDWCEAHAPSSLETAVASGHRAAEKAIALLGRHPLRTQ